MNTDCIDRGWVSSSFDRDNRFGLDHVEDMGRRLVAVFDQRAGSSTRHELPVLAKGSVGVYLVYHTQLFGLAGWDQFAQRNGNQCERGIDRLDRARHGFGNIRLGCRDVAEGAVRLYVRELMTGIDSQRLSGTDLVGDDPLDLVGRERNTPAAKSCDIRKARMGADRHAVFPCNAERLCHDFGVASVKTAGDVG